MGIINISSFIGYSEIDMSDQRDPPYQPRESDVSETSESALSGLYDYFLLSIVRHKCFLIAYIRNRVYISTNYIFLKDLYSTAPKRGSVFIGLMTPDGAIWSRYQRTVLMR